MYASLTFSLLFSNILEALTAHLSLALHSEALYKSPLCTPRTLHITTPLLSLPLSHTYFKHLQYISLSLYTPSTLQITAMPRSLALSLHIHIYICIYMCTYITSLSLSALEALYKSPLCLARLLSLCIYIYIYIYIHVYIHWCVPRALSLYCKKKNPQRT